MVRLAKLEDLPTLSTMGQLFFDESGMSDVMQYDPDSAISTISALISLDTAALFVMEVYGIPVGAVGGVISPFYFNTAERCVSEFFWYVRPEYRGTKDSLRLETALRQWGREHGATIISMAATRNSPEGVHRHYEKQGLIKQETHYLGRL